MADVHDKATRSKNMRAIATRDTAIEKRLASLLETLGLTFVSRMLRYLDALILCWMSIAPSFLPMAVSGITTTAIYLKCPRRELNSGWKKSVKMSCVTSAIAHYCMNRGGGS
jgi:hypothetical protein